MLANAAAPTVLAFAPPVAMLANAAAPTILALVPRPAMLANAAAPTRSLARSLKFITRQWCQGQQRNAAFKKTILLDIVLCTVKTTLPRIARDPPRRHTRGFNRARSQRATSEMSSELPQVYPAPLYQCGSRQGGWKAPKRRSGVMACDVTTAWHDTHNLRHFRCLPCSDIYRLAVIL